MSASYTEQQGANKPDSSFLKFLSRHLLLILVLLWTPLILFQTWNVQHSCFPLVNWGSDRCGDRPYDTDEQFVVQPNPLELDINSMAELCAKVEGIGSINQTIDWYSSDNQIATVDSDGFVTARSKGKVQIFAISKQNFNRSATATVKIPRDTNWFAIGVGSIITAGATVVGVPLPAAIVLGSATATGIHNWHVVNPSFCN